MIHLFSLTKNKTRTTTLDELIQVMYHHKDLLYTEGYTNIGGINFYHFQNDRGDAEFSYGSNSIRIEKLAKSLGRFIVYLNPEERDTFSMRFDAEDVYMADKQGKAQPVPYGGINEIDFFQYTLLNLSYTCSDDSIVKLVELLKDYE
jgi:hypothetical protein